MANAFRSFLEKLGLVAPQKAETPSSQTPAPSVLAPEPQKAPEPIQAPEELPIDIAQEEESFTGESAPTEPMQCNSDHVNCINDPKGCCNQPASHDGSPHECDTCEQTF